MYSYIHYSNGISGKSDSFIVSPYTDNTGFYVTGYKVASASIGQLCRYSFFLDLQNFQN